MKITLDFPKPEFIRTFLISIILSGYCIHTFTQANLIPNGGFEDGKTGWMSWNSEFTITSDSHGGTAAAHIGNRHNPWDALAINLTSVFQNGKEYKLSFWMKIPGPAVNARATLGVTANGVTTYRGICWGLTPVIGKYSFYTEAFTFSYTGEISNVNLYFETDEVNGVYSDYIIDDVILVEIAPDSVMVEFPGIGLKNIKSTIRIGGCATEGNKNYFTSPMAKSQLLHDCNSATVQCYPAWGRWDETGKYVYHIEEFNRRVKELKEDNLNVTAHMLAGWDQYFPAWYRENDFDPDTLDKILKTWIEAIITFEGNDTLVDNWNVVNETQDWDGKGSYWPLFADNFNNACEFQRMGFEPDMSGLPPAMIVHTEHPLYIRKAFEYARQYTDKKLELRDAGFEFPTDSKYKSIYQLVVHLLKNGTPLDVIGFQTHIDLDKYYDWEGYTNNIKRYRALGLEVIIPEVDIGDVKKEWSEEKAELQKSAYYQLVTAAIKGGASDLQTWGFKDGNAGWRQGENAFPYGFDYEQKPAYFGIQEALIDMSCSLYWDMNDSVSDTIPDVMAYNNFGVFLNSPEPEFTPGFVSKALKFDGTDDYLISRELSDTVKGDFSFSLLLKTELSEGGTVAGLLSGDTLRLIIGLDPEGFITLNTGTETILKSGLSINDDSWHMLAVRRDSAVYSLFIDNSQPDTSAEGLMITFNKISVGAGTGGTMPFKGTIDEVRLYDTNIEPQSYTRTLVPAAPMKLSMGITRMVMRLNWQDLSSNEEGFIIERKTLGGIWEDHSITGANITSYSDTVPEYNTEYFYRVRAFNKFGKSCYTLSKSRISPEDPSTFIESESEFPVNDQIIYPNPVNWSFRLNSSEIKEMKVFTMTGKQVITIQNPSQQDEINVSELSQGVYFVMLNDGNRIRCVKMVKQ